MQTPGQAGTSRSTDLSAADESLRRWRNLLACLGLGAIAAFVAALVLLHLAAGRDSPGHMSEFANSPFSLLWGLAVYTVVIGGAMVVWALRPCLLDCPSKWIGIAMLWLAGAGAVLLAAFPADDIYVSSFSGRVHNDAAVGTFVLLGGAMVALAPAFRASPGLGGFARISVLLGVLVTASWVTYLIASLQQDGLYAPVQRVLVGLITVWFALLGLRVRHAHLPRRLQAEPVFVAVKRRKEVPAAIGQRKARKAASRGRRTGRAPAAQTMRAEPQIARSTRFAARRRAPQRA